MSIAWEGRRGRVSIDGQWAWETDDEDPEWVYFTKMPDSVQTYVSDNPGDTDAWTACYSASRAEMHTQAEVLLMKALKRRRKK